MLPKCHNVILTTRLQFFGVHPLVLHSYRGDWDNVMKHGIFIMQEPYQYGGMFVKPKCDSKCKQPFQIPESRFHDISEKATVFETNEWVKSHFMFLHLLRNFQCFFMHFTNFFVNMRTLHSLQYTFPYLSLALRCFWMNDATYHLIRVHVFFPLFLCISYAYAVFSTVLNCYTGCLLSQIHKSWISNTWPRWGTVICPQLCTAPLCMWMACTMDLQVHVLTLFQSDPSLYRY